MQFLLAIALCYQHYYFNPGWVAGLSQVPFLLVCCQVSYNQTETDKAKQIVSISHRTLKSM